MENNWDSMGLLLLLIDFSDFRGKERSSKMFDEQAAILATGELWSLNLQKKSIPRLGLKFFSQGPPEPVSGEDSPAKTNPLVNSRQ